jgi:ADP-ribose pyrophosphatase YjhB (NUDIX family)
MARKPLKYCSFCGAACEQRHIEGRQRLYCPSCREVRYENPIPAATALVLRGESELLLGRRKNDPQKGHWCLPGGFIELGESMEQAALRELKEETGLEGAIISFVDCFYQESRFYGSLIIFGYLVEITGGELQANDDLEEVRYFDLDALPELAFDSHRKLVEQLKKKTAKR